MKLIKRGLCIFLLINAMFLAPVYADTGQELEYAQYIVHLKDRNMSFFNNQSENTIFTANASELSELIELDLVEWYEPDYEIYLHDGEKQYVDTLYDSKWDLHMINAQSAWDFGCTGDNIRIGVIDSGVSYHVDLKNNVLNGYNYIENNDSVIDNIGHGTFVSGIIAAEINGYGTIGVAPEATIIPLKCFDVDVKTTVSTICEAIYDAVDIYNCDIINMSLGVEKYSKTFESAINYAVENGCIVVASVGNHGSETLYYPAAFENVIGVGSINETKLVSDFSQKNNSVFVVAPGENVISTNKEGSYSTKSGTSFAAPVVTGLIADLMEAKGEISIDDVKTMLAETSLDLGETGYDVAYGHGLIDTGQCLNTVINSTNIFISPLDIIDDRLSFSVQNNYSDTFEGNIVFVSSNDNIIKSFDFSEISIPANGKIQIQSDFVFGDIKCFVWKSIIDISAISNMRERQGNKQ